MAGASSSDDESDHREVIRGSSSSFHKSDVEYLDENDEWVYKSPSHIHAVLTDPKLRPANKNAAVEELRRQAPTTKNAEYLSPIHAHKRSELARLGVGTQLYFEYLRQLMILLGLLSVIYFPQIVMCIAGNMNRNYTFMAMSSASIANLGYMPYMPYAVSPHDSAEQIIARPVKMGDNTYDIRGVTLACGLLDFCGVVMIILWIYFFVCRFTPRLVTDNDKANHTLPDHGVMVTKLPPRIDNHENYAMALKAHFETLVHNHRKTSMSLEYLQKNPSDRTKQNVEFQGQNPGALSGLPGLLSDRGSYVYDVVLVRDFKGTIAELKEAGKLKHELALLEAKRRLGGNVKDKEFEKVEEELMNTLGDLSKIHVHASERNVVAAFVTFVHPAHKDFIERQYEGSRAGLLAVTQPHHLRFHGKALHVCTAPCPDDIIWENLDFPIRKRRLMIALIWLAVVLLLAVSFTVVAAIRISDRPEKKFPPPLTTSWQLYTDIRVPVTQDESPWFLCDVDLWMDYACSKPAKFMKATSVFNGTMEPAQDKEGLCRDPSTAYQSVPGMAGFAALEWRQDVVGMVRCLTYQTGNHWITDTSSTQGASKRIQVRACEPINEENQKLVCTIAYFERQTLGFNKLILGEWNELASDNCDMVDFTWLSAPDIEELGDEGGGNSHDWFIDCYCVTNLIRAFRHFQACKESLKNFMLDSLMSVLASASVHIMNAVVKKVIRSLVKYEKPWSNSQRLMLGMSKIFLAQYINTAWIVLLINTKFSNNELEIKGKVVSGEFAEATPGWYNETGADFCTVSFFHIFFPHLLKVCVLPVKSLIRHCKGKNKIVQEELEEVYEAEEFKLDAKYAAVGAMVCFCLTYSAAMPVVVLYTALAMFCIYWCDKLELLLYSARPPMYDEKMSNVAVMQLFLGVFFHTLITCATLGHPIVFPSWNINNKYADKVIEYAVEPSVESRRPFSYHYETEQGLFTKAFWPRVGAYFFSAASFPNFLLWCVLVAFGIFALLFVVFVASSDNVGVNAVGKVWYWMFPAAEQHTELEDIYALMDELETLNQITSYRMSANDDYLPVYHALGKLDQYASEVAAGKEAGEELLRSVFFAEHGEAKPKVKKQKYNQEGTLQSESEASEPSESDSDHIPAVSRSSTAAPAADKRL